MAFEDDLGWEYFGPEPRMSPRMMEHHDFHMKPENMNKTGNYGERFLLFHRQYVDKFDAFRATKGLPPVTAWDPSTPIPANLAHDHPLVLPRLNNDPSSVDPGCSTPTWATIQGGSTPAPGYGYLKLADFKSLDELGRAIDCGWHMKVHVTIGGDMGDLRIAPIDPVFWRWHHWIDNIRVNWVCAHVAS